MSWLSSALGWDAASSMLHPERGYKDAAKETERAWREAQGYQEPFRKAGMNQLPMLQGAESQLLDPSKLLADWMGKYETSPYAKRSMENAQASGMDTASQMGLSGSSAALNNVQNSSSDIMNADRTQFLQDLMQKFMTGIGVGQNIYNTGAATAGNMGQQRIGVGQDLAGAAYGARNAPGDMLRNLLAMAGKAYMQGGAGA